jgi:hypothetical protein
MPSISRRSTIAVTFKDRPGVRGHSLALPSNCVTSDYSHFTVVMTTRHMVHTLLMTGSHEAQLNLWSPKFIHIMFKNSVRTAKKTQLFTITKINWLTLFKEIIAVYSENHTKPMNTKMQSYWLSKQVGQKVTTGQVSYRTLSLLLHTVFHTLISAMSVFCLTVWSDTKCMKWMYHRKVICLNALTFEFENICNGHRTNLIRDWVDTWQRQA